MTWITCDYRGEVELCGAGFEQWNSVEPCIEQLVELCGALHEALELYEAVLGAVELRGAGLCGSEQGRSSGIIWCSAY